MNTVREFVDHPQLKARNRWREVASPVGPLHALLPPVTMAGVDTVMGPIPGVGEHTDRILEELELSSEQTTSLRQMGTI